MAIDSLAERNTLHRRPLLKLPMDLQVMERLSTEHVNPLPRYAFDRPGTQRREQLVRVDYDENDGLYKVVVSILALPYQRFGFRKLTDKYDVELEDDLGPVWLRKGETDNLLSTYFTTDGGRVFEASVGIDCGYCLEDTFSGPDYVLANLRKKHVPFEDFSDRDRVAFNIRQLAKLKRSESLSYGVGALYNIHNWLLGKHAGASGLTVPLIDNVSGKPLLVLEHPTVLPVQFTQPGKRQLDAIIGRQFYARLSGREDEWRAQTMRDVCTHHNINLGWKPHELPYAA